MQILPHAGPVFSACQSIFWDLSSHCVCIQVLWALGILLPLAGRFRLILPIAVLLVQLPCQQKGSLLAILLVEGRQQYLQCLLTVSPARFTCWMSNIPCNNRKTSLLLHPTLLILEQSNSLLESELPTANRQLAAHAGLFSRRHPCLGPACLSGTEGTGGAALGTHSGTHN